MLFVVILSVVMVICDDAACCHNYVLLSWSSVTMLQDTTEGITQVVTTAHTGVITGGHMGVMVTGVDIIMDGMVIFSPLTLTYPKPNPNLILI